MILSHSDRCVFVCVRVGMQATATLQYIVYYTLFKKEKVKHLFVEAAKI